MTRLLVFASLLLLLLSLCAGCGGSDAYVAPGDPFEDGEAVGSDDTFEIVTWNLETFAKDGTETVELVIQAIEMLDVDIVALQEIQDATRFRELYDGLDNWSGVKTSSAYGDMDLAFLYRTDGALTVTRSPYEILTDEWELPRSPYVLECEFDGVPLIVINNHFKAMADSESEYRRREGCVLIEQYVAQNFADDKVIIVGDMNDELTDAPGDNVFSVFLDAESEWRFVDLPIAEDPSAQWSYPTWPSHIDHILISDELFAEADAAGAETHVLPLHTYFSNFGKYDAAISDHLPVMFRFTPVGDGSTGGDPDPDPDNPFNGAALGDATTCEIVTWNLEHFAKDGATTVERAAQAVRAMGADIVALQEIEDTVRFDDLIAALDGWSGQKANSAYGDANLAYLWRTDGALTVQSVTEVLTDEGQYLPRSPLLMECTFDGKALVVINNHFKCCGDGEIVDGSDWDEEYRRQQASILLDDYVASNHAGERVVIVGDLNDELTDPAADNVFNVFLDAPVSWRFVDLPIEEGSSSAWSYPSWPSHLDHILVSDELFAAADAVGADVSVVQLDDYLGGWSAYDSALSDHLPVAFVFTP